MVRYLISLVVLLSCVVFIIIASGAAILSYIDIPSFIFAGILPLLFIGIVFGFKEMTSAFSVAFKNGCEKDKLIKALNFFKAYNKAVWISGLIAVLTGLIPMLRWLEDTMNFGKNLAVVLISVLYCGIIDIAVIIPFTVCIRKQLKEEV